MLAREPLAPVGQADSGATWGEEILAQPASPPASLSPANLAPRLPRAPSASHPVGLVPTEAKVRQLERTPNTNSRPHRPCAGLVNQARQLEILAIFCY